MKFYKYAQFTHTQIRNNEQDEQARESEERRCRRRRSFAMICVRCVVVGLDL